MAGIKRPRVYDDGTYKDFGKQPETLEIKFGYGLIPLVENTCKDTEPVLLKEISYCRNQIDAEYGVPLPVFRIRDDMVLLTPCEYGIYINGSLIEKNDLGALSDDETKQSVAAEEIRNHLYKVIKQNFSRLLNQCMVNQLVNKVSDINPDVVDDLYLQRSEVTSVLKNILIMLLEEDVSIRDMNSILEAFADYKNIPEKIDNNLVSDIVDKIREKISYQFFAKLADEKKKLHVIRLSQKDAEYIEDNDLIRVPNDVFQRASISLDFELMNKLVHQLELLFNEHKEYSKIILCSSQHRSALYATLKGKIENFYVISDVEVYEAINDYSIEIMGETHFVD